jgi:hypothetical protein
MFLIHFGKDLVGVTTDKKDAGEIAGNWGKAAITEVFRGQPAVYQFRDGLDTAEITAYTIMEAWEKARKIPRLVEDTHLVSVRAIYIGEFEY